MRKRGRDYPCVSTIIWSQKTSILGNREKTARRRWGGGHLPGRRKLPSCRQTNPGTCMRRRGRDCSVRLNDCDLVSMARVVETNIYQTPQRFETEFRDSYWMWSLLPTRTSDSLWYRSLFESKSSRCSQRSLLESILIVGLKIWFQLHTVWADLWLWSQK